MPTTGLLHRQSGKRSGSREILLLGWGTYWIITVFFFSNLGVPGLEVSDVALSSLLPPPLHFFFSKNESSKWTSLGVSGKVLKSGRGQFESGTEGQGAGLSKTQDQGRSHVLGSGFVSGRED